MTQVSTKGSGDKFNVEDSPHKIIYEAKDEHGNNATCTFNVVVNGKKFSSTRMQFFNMTIMTIVDVWPPTFTLCPPNWNIVAEIPQEKARIGTFLFVFTIMINIQEFPNC